MAYEKKTWENRQSEFPNRRTLAPVDGQENTYDVTRAEGLVMEEGDAFDQESMNDLENRIYSGFADAGVNVYSHTRSGTVHKFTGTGANGRAKMTADVQAGDTFMVNGTPVTAYMGTDDATGSMAGSPWNGKWVSFIVEGGTLNFKGGGGKVTVTGLAADAVKKGTTVTVKQGAKTIASVTGSYYSKLACLYSTDAVFTARYEVDSEYIDISMNSFRPDLSGNPRYNGELTVKKTFTGLCVTVPGNYTSIPKNAISTFTAGSKYNIIAPGENQPYGIVIIRI